MLADTAHDSDGHSAPFRQRPMLEKAMTSKPYLPALDGLRGIASLSVVLYHLGHWLDMPWLGANSDLAVDLFFCLSGYVIPLSYDSAASPGLTSCRFVALRLIRLMPIIILATMTSAIYVFARQFLKSEDPYNDQLLIALILGSLTIPYLGAPHSIGGPQIFPLNGPQYTLFLEIVINILWFAIRGSSFRVRTSIAVFFVCLGGVALFGLGGDTASTFWMGFPRVGVSFFAGVFIFHLSHHQRFKDVKARIGRIFLPLLLIMLAIFYFPDRVGAGIVLLWISVISPLIVASGTCIGASSRGQRLCRWGGALSYPVYALHYPIFCWLNGIYRTTGHVTTWPEVPIVVALVVAISAVILWIYDRPVREYLTAKLNGNRLGGFRRDHYRVGAVSPLSDKVD